MKLRSSAMLIAIVLAILISGAVTASSYLVLINKSTADNLASSNIAYYDAYGSMQNALKTYGRVIDKQRIIDNLGKLSSRSRSSNALTIDTTNYLNINQVSLGKTKDNSRLGPADESSPKLSRSDQITYYVQPYQENEFFWSKLMISGAVVESDAQISFELVGKDGQISVDRVSINDSFHKIIKGCSGQKNDICELKIGVESESADAYINYAINPNEDYGNLTNYSIISTAQVRVGTTQIAEKKLIARFDLISKNLINIMEYECKNCDK